MASTRVHEVAKQLGMSSKETVSKFVALGVKVSSHASSVSDEDIDRLVKSLDSVDGKSQSGKASTKAAPAKTAKASKTSRQDQAPKPAAKTQPSKAKAPETTKSKKESSKPKSAEAAPKAQPAKSEAPQRAVEPKAKEPEQAAPKAPAAQQQPAPQTEGAEAAEPGTEAAAPAAVESDVIHVPHGVTVEELAEKVDKPAGEIIKMLLVLGEMKTINQSLPDALVDLVAQELGMNIEVVSVEEEAKEQEEQQLTVVDDPSELEPRAPIVTVMGHVDHGKSSILQQYRKKEMLALEAGGITQAIGAYQVHDPEGGLVTFIDTPGHEAFTQMRARGAQVTDIAILVVAADDGVQPQTVEAMDHAVAAGVPIIVAVNKIDKPEADPIRARQQLAELGLQPEEWGGETVFVDVSAKQGTNLDELLEMIHLVTEMQELKANPNTSARGVSIEAHLDKGRGPVATLIVQRGTLKVGEPLVCGAAWCRVRAMTDEAGHKIKKAGPSRPVLVTGWSKVPEAGDEFKVVADDREAKRIAQERESRLRQAEFAAGGKPMSLEDLLSKTRTGDVPELKLIVKANTQGAIEALAESIDKMDSTLVKTVVQRRAVGAINENDIWMAKASGAIVVGFAVRPDAGARQLAEKEGVDVRLYEVIYQLLDDIEKATHGLLAPLEEEVVTGTAEVRELFKTPKGMVAGCYITEGNVRRNSRVRLLREGNVMHSSE
ncbi:MAG: translation initiation factor IF-2, partial [Actinobacteria bacterium]|nr:translation initiation factor IF-2 [Actinomycetota bacterium]